MQFHISNLNSSLIESDLHRIFSSFGEVEDVQLIRDKLNNRSHGRGYVTMPVPREAEQALIHLNGATIKGRCYHKRKKNRGGAGGVQPGPACFLVTYPSYVSDAHFLNKLKTDYGSHYRCRQTLF